MAKVTLSRLLGRLGAILLFPAVAIVILTFSVAQASLPPSIAAPPREPGAAARTQEQVKSPSLQINSPVDDKEARPASRPASLLHNQYDNFSYSNVSSQNFEPAFDVYDAQGADDFLVPLHLVWTIDQVDVAGVYSGPGQAQSVNVFFYTNNGGLPGPAVITQTGLIPSVGLENGSFDIPLDSPVVLGPGHYWVSVQANQNLDAEGQWFWRNRYSGQYNLAAWRNPGGGFSRSLCTTEWGHRAEECFISDESDDQAFRLFGTSASTGTATPTVTGTPPSATPSGTATSTLTPRPPTSTSIATATGTHIVPPPVVTRVAELTPTTPTPRPSPSPTAPCGLGWRGVASPNSGQSTNELHALAVVGPDDVWAVGHYLDESTSAYRPLTLHWNGSQWGIVPAPALGFQGYLWGVTALSSNEVWAVGGYEVISGFLRTLTMRWNGTAWTVVPSPNLGSGGNRLKSIDASSPQDIWAVGSQSDSGGPDGTLTMHWDGNAWTVVNSPSPGTQANDLRAVEVISPNEAWAVGTYLSGFPGYLNLAMRWNGTTWTHTSAQNPGEDNAFNGITALGPNDVWAVGFTYDGFEVSTLVERWNGSGWTRVPSPNVGNGDRPNYLLAVDAISPSDIWAVGVHGELGGGQFQAMSMHWDGAQWTIVPTYNANYNFNFLQDVKAVSPTEVWAAGYYHVQPGSEATLIERYNDPCLTPTPTNIPKTTPTSTYTPTLTNTPTSTFTSTPTNTPTSTYTPTSTHTNTPNPIPTLCPITFTDMPTTDPFYASIRCLACRGIVSGYADGTFRPNNPVTRGQLAKMVSNAAGFNEPVSGQTFQDVPPNHTFYEWIERLTARGYMTGYPCTPGSPLEPCVGPNNKPYFRPGANATRGQTAKIVANAANFTEPVSGQTFQDVPSNHTFYEFIQRLVNRNVMSGYPCGGPGEPCVGDRPYFRPGNDVTRGQSAKIVANSFFPDCVTP